MKAGIRPEFKLWILKANTLFCKDKEIWARDIDHLHQCFRKLNFYPYDLGASYFPGHYRHKIIGELYIDYRVHIVDFYIYEQK